MSQAALFIIAYMTRHTGNGKQPHRGAPHSASPPVDKKRDSGAEDAARAAAERLLTPPEPSAPAEAAPTAAAEPSLEQRLADIDRRAKQRATEEKAALAAHYLTEARNGFRRAVSRTTDEAVKTAFEEMQRLERLAGDAGTSTGGRGDGGDRPSSADAGDRPTRERRSPDSLRADAQKLFDWIKAHPQSKGSAATEATGVVVKQPLNARTFIEKYLPGAKVKTEGQKAGTLYSIH